jgi:hypothetical protein
MTSNKIWLAFTIIMSIVIFRSSVFFPQYLIKYFDNSLIYLFSISFVPLLIYFFIKQQNLFFDNIKKISDKQLINNNKKLVDNSNVVAKD